MKSVALDEDESDDKTFTYELASSGGVKRKIGEEAEQEKHTIPVQGSCNEHAEAVRLLLSYSQGVRKSLKDVFEPEDSSEQRASASLPDSVPRESEEESVLHVYEMTLLRSMLSGIMRQTQL
jgi:hypothetical protein